VNTINSVICVLISEWSLQKKCGKKKFLYLQGKLEVYLPFWLCAEKNNKNRKVCSKLLNKNLLRILKYFDIFWEFWSILTFFENSEVFWHFFENSEVFWQFLRILKYFDIIWEFWSILTFFENSEVFWHFFKNQFYIRNRNVLWKQTWCYIYYVTSALHIKMKK
jgi:hypothetical protein